MDLYVLSCADINVLPGHGISVLVMCCYKQSGAGCLLQSTLVSTPENIIRACQGLKAYLAYLKATPKRRTNSSSSSSSSSNSSGLMLQPLPSNIGEVSACVCQVAMWTSAEVKIHPSMNRNYYTPLFEAGHHLDLWELLGAKVLDTTKYRLQVRKGDGWWDGGKRTEPGSQG